jgi:hypothetical protein
MSKIITPELINERLEAKGFGDEQMCDDDLAKESVLKHFHVEFTDQWTDDASYYIYEDTTTDGYSVYVATYDRTQININENVYYYDHDLSDALVEAIRYGNGDEDIPDLIYVDDLHQDFIDSAIQELFSYLSLRFEKEIIEQLKSEGYKQLKDEGYEQ